MAIVRVVLLRPESPGNVGSAARAIANTGLAGLDLVNPCDWRTIEAWRMAWRAEEILEGARVLSTLDEALEGAVYTAGLAGREGTRVKHITVRQMAQEVASLGKDAKVSIVFGCESKGLSEKDLLHCQRRVVIPSHPIQPSLNLAQAVMVTGYELFMAGEAPDPPTLERADGAEIERALRSLREAMLEIGFLPVENPEARFCEWREIFGRAGTTPRDVKLILALARRIKGAAGALRRARESQQ